MTALLRPPILVTGTPRSGKTCISGVLRTDRSLAYLSEPLTIWDAGMGWRADDRRSAADVTAALRSRIRRACARQVSRGQKTRYLDDLAYHALRVPFVHAVMPEAKIIHVIRDPRRVIPEMLYGWTYRDSVARAFIRRRRALHVQGLPGHLARFVVNYFQSRIRGHRMSWGPRVPGLAEFAARHTVVEVAAFQWRQMVAIARSDLAQLAADRWLEVRYEDLVADPYRQARRIAEFCELHDASRIAAAAEQMIDPHFAFDKVVQPNERQWHVVRPIIEPLQEELGYGCRAPLPGVNH